MYSYRCILAAEHPVMPLLRKEKSSLPTMGGAELYCLHMSSTIFEEELGYKARVVDQETIPGAFEAVAMGWAHIFTSAWFPTRDFTFAKYPTLVKLGQVYGGKDRDAYEGWMVSTELARQYNLTHIEDLNNPAVASALDIDGNGRGNVISSPSDWVAAKRNPEILKDYGMTSLYEIEGTTSEEQMLSTIAERLKQGKPALFYMYQPVAFPGDTPITNLATWLKGTESYLPLAFNRTVVRCDLIVNYPDIAKILTRYRIKGSDISWAMGQIADKGDSPKHLSELAQSWIDSHRADVDSWLQGVKGIVPPAKPAGGVLPIAYSPEKEDLFLKLVMDFNLSRPQDVLPIYPLRLDMADMLREAVDGKFAAISPDSSIWLDQLDRMWEQRNPGASPLVGSSTRYALSPIVIAMWENKAKEMGYPSEAIGWQDIMEKASTDPEFKWSHPAATTAPGLLAITAEFYAGADKKADLTTEDLQVETTLDYVKAIEATVDRYGGESEDKVVTRMLALNGLGKTRPFGLNGYQMM